MADEKKKTGHTPGPWRVSVDAPSFVLGPSDYVVADVDWRAEAGGNTANAALIAAAPDMAEVLLDLLQNVDLRANRAAAVRNTLRKAGVLP